MKILVVSSSARGHAIAEALSKSNENPEIISLLPSSNPGIESIASEVHEGDVMNFDLALELAKRHKFDFAVVGPDDPIGAGIADVLKEVVPCVAPTKNLARIESSKGFARKLLLEEGVDASPKFSVFTRANRELLNNFIAQDLNGEYVVKYDALKGGKGVKISGEHLSSINEGVTYANECINECGQVVVEEKLVGVEFSLISFVSGNNVIDTPVVQDHKRAYAGDTGPNTGGMGTYSDANHSLPFLSKEDLDRAHKINVLTAKALEKKCGAPFIGFLYGGFIAVKDGVKLIEYNARLGDPEALNILPLLTSDFVHICQGMITGELSENMVSFAPKATVCKYITPEGYPDNKNQRGEIFKLPPIPSNARVYYGDVKQNNNGELLLGGSRSVGIVGIGESISEAEDIAQNICEKVEGPVRFRSDIGKEELVNQRVTTLKQIRS